MSKKNVVIEKFQCACRLRQIRENAGLTQENFSEILGISLSAYKKVESGENQVSISCLRNLHNEMNVSADYVLFGKNQNMEGAWETVLNCTEVDKMLLMLRLMMYFTNLKKSIFPLKEDQLVKYDEVDHLVKSIKMFEENNGKEDINC